MPRVKKQTAAPPAVDEDIIIGPLSEAEATADPAQVSEAEALLAAVPDAPVKSVRARALIKMPGGKATLAPTIAALLPATMKTYFEPFAGAASVYFALANKGRFGSAVLGDLNRDVIDILQAAQSSVEELIQFLSVYAYDKDMYAKIRAQEPSKLGLVMRAARTIYIAKTGFNGLMRYNSKGQCNVPFGRYTNPKICDEPNLRAVSALLNEKATDLMVADFEATVAIARKGDGVYFDPPYLPRSKTANFTSYTKEKFGMEEHRRLAACFRKLADKGVAVVLSNADTEEARALYCTYDLKTVQARRSINCAKDKRQPVSEILVTANTP
jgi:DNA adenine methylase